MVLRERHRLCDRAGDAAASDADPTMRADLATAERNAAVRRAAAAWREAGVIDEPALARIVGLFPDDRVRAGVAFRILFGFFTVVAGFAVCGLFAVGGFEKEAPLVVGVGAALATEVLVGLARRREGGIEEGTAFLTLVMLSIGVTLNLPASSHRFETGLRVALAVATVVCAAIVRRWGMPTYAGIGAAGVYLLLAQTSIGPGLWVLLPLVTAPLLLGGARSSSLAPAGREACSWALVVSLAAVGIATNLAAAQHHWIAHLDVDSHAFPDAGLAPWLYTLYTIGTAVLPLLLIALAVRLRDRVVLWCGTATVVASLVTLRYYVHLAPLWLELIAGGAVVIAVVLLLRRWLDSGPRRERGGFTAQPSFSSGERTRLIEVAATIAAFTPPAQAVGPHRGFEGRGGEFGGGGASDSF
jgi:uncharacterized membrane protein YgcG